MNFIMRWFRKYYLEKSGLERISPNDWIKLDKDGRRELEGILTVALKRNIKIFSIADTNSMDGLMDIGHNVIGTDEFDKAKLAVGDIVIYQLITTLIIHRIVEVHGQEAGKWYRTRGDNNIDNDPYPVVDIQIKWLCLGILY